MKSYFYDIYRFACSVFIVKNRGFVYGVCIDISINSRIEHIDFY